MVQLTTERYFLNALGMVNALGGDVATIARGLAAGDTSGMGEATIGRTHAFVGRVQSPLDVAPPASLSYLDCRNNRLLLAALAQIEPTLEQMRTRYGGGRIAVVLGTSTSGIEAGEAALYHQHQGGSLPPSFDYRQMEIGSVAPFLAEVCGLAGPAFTVSTACTSSAKAFASARRLLRADLCDAVIVGGVDSLCELTLLGFGSLASTSPTLTNPLSARRSGINIGEGAALFVMSREAGPAWLAGVGESSDAHHLSAPDPEGVGGELALRGALADAGIEASAVGYVNLHATATPKNDEMESALMDRVFPDGVPTSGTKPLVGHTLGAAGAIELAFTWLTLTGQTTHLPLHVWDGIADPALPTLDLVETPRTLGGRRFAMSNSFAFGGSNASLILGAD
jgi:3-oxoacyl-[acyl-carrier-protein] synthase-1